MSEVVHPRPLRATGALGIPMPRPKKVVATGSSSSITATEIATGAAASSGVRVVSLQLAFLLVAASLPELFREFGQIKTKLRSLRRPSEL